MSIPSKTSWPEVVGKTSEEAVEIIRKDFKGYIMLLTERMACTLSYDTNRVTVSLDGGNQVKNDKGEWVVVGGTVARAPRIG